MVLAVTASQCNREKTISLTSGAGKTGQPLSLQIFSLSVGCLFLLFMAFFAVQKLLIKSHLLIFVFIFITLGDGPKKTLLPCMSQCSAHLWEFVASHLAFRSLIHFEFIFLYSVRECSDFILLHVAVQFTQHHVSKRLSFLYCIFLPPLSQISWP